MEIKFSFCNRRLMNQIDEQMNVYGGLLNPLSGTTTETFLRCTEPRGTTHFRRNHHTPTVILCTLFHRGSGAKEIPSISINKFRIIATITSRSSGKISLFLSSTSNSRSTISYLNMWVFQSTFNSTIFMYIRHCSKSRQLIMITPCSLFSSIKSDSRFLLILCQII